MVWRRLLERIGLGVALGSLVHAGCNSSTFVCEASDECGAAGTCQAPGFCSFPDSSCESGQRFGELAGEFGGDCVAVGEGTDAATSSAGGTSAAATTSSGSSTGASGSAQTSASTSGTTAATRSTSTTAVTSSTSSTTTGVSEATSTTVADDGSSSGGATTEPPPPRVTDGLAVLYDFSSMAGGVVPDVSGVDPVMPLEVVGAGFSLTPTGLEKSSGDSILRYAEPPGGLSKVHVLCQASNEITVEAWVTSSSAPHNPSRVISYSASGVSRNFTLGLDDNLGISWRLRVQDNYNGLPEVTVPTAGGDAPLHMVATHRSDGSEAIYINGIEAETFSRPGTFSIWDPTNNHALGLGDELNLSRPWFGEFHLVAVYDRALSAGEVGQNFDAGF